MPIHSISATARTMAMMACTASRESERGRPNDGVKAWPLRDSTRRSAADPSLPFVAKQRAAAAVANPEPLTLNPKP